MPHEIQEVELVGAVGDRRLDLLEPARKPVLHVTGQVVARADVTAAGQQVMAGGQHRGQIERWRLGDGLVADPDEVPVVVEALGHAAQLLGGDAQLQGQHERALQFRPGDQLGVEDLEPLLEVDVGQRSRRGR